jgi:outer membrane protein OmpA-like peptidoglycan-associated protein
VAAGFSLAPNFDPKGRDTDEDGLADGEDRCPNDTEDVDAFEDEDGCPDRDNDADGREDAVDRCVNDPEDDDGYMDNDGCPDPDNDKDGVKDATDRCPDQAENANGVDDEDGCPDEDADADNDADGIRDAIDRCPYDAEDQNQFEDDDGCPDERLKNARVVVTKGSIKIKDVIYFDTGKSTIQKRSYDLMDEIAGVVAQHPELLKIRVEGHTDNVGNPLKNLQLSQDRAQAVVKYLISKGIAAERLDSAGFGEQKPIAPNTNEDGRSQNRRVEFIIVDRAD